MCWSRTASHPASHAACTARSVASSTRERSRPNTRPRHDTTDSLDPSSGAAGGPPVRPWVTRATSLHPVRRRISSTAASVMSLPWISSRTSGSSPTDAPGAGFFWASIASTSEPTSSSRSPAVIVMVGGSASRRVGAAGGAPFAPAAMSAAARTSAHEALLWITPS
jgi:hypothetical protein